MSLEFSRIFSHSFVHESSNKLRDLSYSAKTRGISLPPCMFVVCLAVYSKAGTFVR